MTFAVPDVPITLQEIAEIEAAINVNIPLAMRSLYQQFNGGYPNPYIFESGGGAIPIAEFLPLKSANRESSVEVYRYFAFEEKLVPTRLFPFANDAGGNYLFVDTATPDGKVFILWHDTIDPNPLKSLNVGFSEFWASLKEDS